MVRKVKKTAIKKKGDFFLMAISLGLNSLMIFWWRWWYPAVCPVSTAATAVSAVSATTAVSDVRRWGDHVICRHIGQEATLLPSLLSSRLLFITPVSPSYQIPFGPTKFLVPVINLCHTVCGKKNHTFANFWLKKCLSSRHLAVIIFAKLLSKPHPCSVGTTNPSQPGPPTSLIGHHHHFPISFATTTAFSSFFIPPPWSVNMTRWWGINDPSGGPPKAASASDSV